MVASVVFVNILLINCFQFFFLCKNLILWNTQNFTKVTQPLVSKPTGPLKTYSQSSIIDIHGFEYLRLDTGKSECKQRQGASFTDKLKFADSIFAGSFSNTLTTKFDDQLYSV